MTLVRQHKRVVLGIKLVTLLWTDGEPYIPIDYRIYNKAQDGLTKSDHFRAMFQLSDPIPFSRLIYAPESCYNSGRDEDLRLRKA